MRQISQKITGCPVYAFFDKKHFGSLDVSYGSGQYSPLFLIFLFLIKSVYFITRSRISINIGRSLNATLFTSFNRK